MIEPWTDTKLSCYTAPWGRDGLIHAISDISKCGFAAVECPAFIVQRYEDRLHVFQEILENSGLGLSGLLQKLNLLDRDRADEQVELAANSARFVNAAGKGILTICHNTEQTEPMTDDDWATACAVVEEIGKRCEEFNVDLCFMPRANRLIGTEREIKRLLVSTDPEYVKLAIDTGEIALAGGSPQKLLKTFSDRVRTIRLRDVSGSKRRAKVTMSRVGTAPQFGRGAVDFFAVSKTIMSIGYTGVLTLDFSGESSDPANMVKNGYRFLVRKSGLFPEQ